MIKRMSAKILLLDDEETIRNIMPLLLSRAGHTVTAVAIGEEAIEEYKKHFQNGEKFDLVLLDLTIPHGKGGREIMPDLLAIDPDIVAIVASGDDTNQAVKEYEKFGFKGVLLKPFNRATLISAIEKYAPHAV
jgi:CheY-like chemotaxis protein